LSTTVLDAFMHDISLMIADAIGDFRSKIIST
jgi:isochorismate hydrolase